MTTLGPLGPKVVTDVTKPKSECIIVQNLKYRMQLQSINIQAYSKQKKKKKKRFFRFLSLFYVM